MTNWTRRLAVFLGASTLLPILGEFMVSRIKSEQYDMTVALTIVAVVAPVALVLYYVKPVRLTARFIMSLGLMTAGLATAAVGFLMTTESVDDPFRRESVQVTIGAVLMVIGLMVLSIGALYIGRTRFDNPAELPAPPPSADPTEVKVERYQSFRAGPHNPLISKIIARMSTKDLHYLAYYVDGKCVMTLDLLDHPELAGYHEVTEPYQRREEYFKQGTALDKLLHRLNEEFRPLNTGDLIRLVLDVERGAIYYYVVTTDTNRFLIGVTLNQLKVHVADARMAQLVDDIRVHLGQPKMTELEQVDR